MPARPPMSSMTAPTWLWATGPIAGIALSALGLVALPGREDRLRTLGRWLIAPAAAAPSVLALILERTCPPERLASDALPEVLRHGYWFWVGAFATCSAVAFAWAFRSARSSAFRGASA